MKIIVSPSSQQVAEGTLARGCFFMTQQQIEKKMKNDILRFLRVERGGKYTSFGVLSERFCLRKLFVESMKSLLDSGQIRKTKSGLYRANKAASVDREKGAAE